MGYDWPGWALDALRGIEPFEVVQALGATRRWPRRASGPQGLTVVTIWARTGGGRPLIIAVRQIDDWDWLILGARDMRLPERRNSRGGKGTGMGDLPEDPAGFMESLEFRANAPEDELPPAGAPVMVVRSLRLPVEVDARVKAAAAQRGVSTSTLIREWIEQELAALDHDEPISRADALRALAGVRAVGRPTTGP